MTSYKTINNNSFYSFLRSLSLALPVSLSPSPSAPLCLCLSLSFLALSVSLLSPSLFVSFSPLSCRLSLTRSLSVCLPVSLSLSLSLSLSVVLLSHFWLCHPLISVVSCDVLCSIVLSFPALYFAHHKQIYSQTHYAIPL